MTDTTVPVFAGFWRRLFAFLIDGLILGVPGLVAGGLLFETFAAVEGPTRLIGLAIGLVYFGLLSSSVGGSATLGMRMLGMRVVTTKGRPLDPIRSLWRALVLQLPFTLNGMMWQTEDQVLALAYGVLAITCVFGVGLAQIVLLIFNHPSRRLVHDLVSGSVVVRRGVEAPPKTRSWAPATAFAIILVTAASAGAMGYGLVPWASWLPQNTRANLDSLTEVQQAVVALPGVMEAGVMDNTSTHYGAEKRTFRTLVITVRLKAWPKDEKAEVERIAKAVLKVRRLEPGQGMTVVLTQGFDIGIARGSRSSAHPYVPAPEQVGSEVEPASPEGQGSTPAQAAPA